MQSDVDDDGDAKVSSKRWPRFKHNNNNSIKNNNGKIVTYSYSAMLYTTIQMNKLDISKFAKLHYSAYIKFMKWKITLYSVSKWKERVG